MHTNRVAQCGASVLELHIHAIFRLINASVLEKIGVILLCDVMEGYKDQNTMICVLVLKD